MMFRAVTLLSIKQINPGMSAVRAGNHSPQEGGSQGGTPAGTSMKRWLSQGQTQGVCPKYEINQFS